MNVRLNCRPALPGRQAQDESAVGIGGGRARRQETPSFFCRLVEEVVYWKVRRLSGKT